ncbi:hypothetical protein N7463_006141 [Penicillium fimorum]|uniref:Uncharacterized protein n=1 Tax=Penicillium fimorum TaxID=1882269 RepID=A0A9W9XTS9_9EURO|nr:hypothetical protein N7463_006141 [Penicillium fimorum]
MPASELPTTMHFHIMRPMGYQLRSLESPTLSPKLSYNGVTSETCNQEDLSPSTLESATTDSALSIIEDYR